MTTDRQLDLIAESETDLTQAQKISREAIRFDNPLLFSYDALIESFKEQNEDPKGITQSKTIEALARVPTPEGSLNLLYHKIAELRTKARFENGVTLNELVNGYAEGGRILNYIFDTDEKTQPLLDALIDGSGTTNPQGNKIIDTNRVSADFKEKLGLPTSFNVNTHSFNLKNAGEIYILSNMILKSVHGDALQTPYKPEEYANGLEEAVSIEPVIGMNYEPATNKAQLEQRLIGYKTIINDAKLFDDGTVFGWFADDLPEFEGTTLTLNAQTGLDFHYANNRMIDEKIKETQEFAIQLVRAGHEEFTAFTKIDFDFDDLDEDHSSVTTTDYAKAEQTALLNQKVAYLENFMISFESAGSAGIYAENNYNLSGAERVTGSNYNIGPAIPNFNANFEAGPWSDFKSYLKFVNELQETVQANKYTLPIQQLQLNQKAILATIETYTPERPVEMPITRGKIDLVDPRIVQVMANFSDHGDQFKAAFSKASGLNEQQINMIYEDAFEPIHAQDHLLSFKHDLSKNIDKTAYFETVDNFDPNASPDDPTEPGFIGSLHDTTVKAQEFIQKNYHQLKSAALYPEEIDYLIGQTIDKKFGTSDEDEAQQIEIFKELDEMSGISDELKANAEAQIKAALEINDDDSSTLKDLKENMGKRLENLSFSAKLRHVISKETNPALRFLNPETELELRKQIGESLGGKLQKAQANGWITQDDALKITRRTQLPTILERAYNDGVDGILGNNTIEVLAVLNDALIDQKVKDGKIVEVVDDYFKNHPLPDKSGNVIKEPYAQNQREHLANVINDFNYTLAPYQKTLNDSQKTTIQGAMARHHANNYTASTPNPDTPSINDPNWRDDMVGGEYTDSTPNQNAALQHAAWIERIKDLQHLYGQEQTGEYEDIKPVIKDHLTLSLHRYFATDQNIELSYEGKSYELTDDGDLYELDNRTRLKDENGIEAKPVANIKDVGLKTDKNPMHGLAFHVISNHLESDQTLKKYAQQMLLEKDRELEDKLKEAMKKADCHDPQARAAVVMDALKKADSLDAKRKIINSEFNRSSPDGDNHTLDTATLAILLGNVEQHHDYINHPDYEGVIHNTDDYSDWHKLAASHDIISYVATGNFVNTLDRYSEPEANKYNDTIQPDSFFENAQIYTELLKRMPPDRKYIDENLFTQTELSRLEDYTGGPLSRDDVEKIALEIFVKKAANEGIAEKDISKAMFEGEFNPWFTDAELAFGGLGRPSQYDPDHIAQLNAMDIKENAHWNYMDGENQRFRNVEWNKRFGSFDDMNQNNDKFITSMNHELKTIDAKDIATRFAMRKMVTTFDDTFGIKRNSTLTYDDVVKQIKDPEMLAAFNAEVDHFMKNQSAISYFQMQAKAGSNFNLIDDYQNNMQRYLNKPRNNDITPSSKRQAFSDNKNDMTGSDLPEAPVAPKGQVTHTHDHETSVTQSNHDPALQLASAP